MNPTARIDLDVAELIEEQFVRKTADRDRANGAAWHGPLPAEAADPSSGCLVNAETGLPNWKPGYLAVKENGCS